MAFNQIFTTGANQSIPTTSEGRATPGDWVAAHVENVTGTEFDLGNKLTTSWPDAGSPPDRTHSTERLEDESDEDYLDRHLAEAIDVMAEHPPIP